MVLLKEFRVVMPLSLEEYQIGQLYSVAKLSNQETHDDAGVEILKNEPFENEEMGKGQYTHKIYHLGSRLPGWVRAVAPASALMLEEEAWNAFPYCKTVLTSPFMGDKFKFVIESRHYADKGEQENVHKLAKDQLKKRKVEFIDITTQPDKKEYIEEEDTTKFHSEKTGRGPLKSGWQEDADPVMCAYKLVTVEFRMWGLQTKVENFMMGMETNIFLRLHKQIFCWIDEWYGMSISDVREYEAKVKEQMQAKINAGVTATKHKEGEKIEPLQIRSPDPERPGAGEDGEEDGEEAGADDDAGEDEEAETEDGGKGKGKSLKKSKSKGLKKSKGKSKGKNGE